MTKVRKPRQVKKNGETVAFASHWKNGPYCAVIGKVTFYEARHLRMIADFATQAAAWIEQQERINP